MCSVIAGLTALGGYAQYRQQQQAANAQASAYRAQAAAAEQNARIENRKQEQIADNYAQQQRQLRARYRLTAGQQRAAAGSAGLNYAGSVADLGQSSLENYRDDAMTLLSNQRNDNYSSRVAESNYISQANAANAAASNVKRASRMAGLSTILGTAASVYGVAQPWKNATAAKTAFAAPTSSLGYGTDWTSSAKSATGILSGKPFFSMGTGKKYAFNNQLTY